MNLLKKIINFSLPNWLIATLGLVFILRIPSFFEPFSYGDEMIYLTLGEAIRQGLVLYRDIHDNKPPLLYILAAIAGNVFWFRVILAFWNIIYIVIFWVLLKRLLPKNPKGQKVGTFIFAILSTIPLFEGQIANSEVFMIGFSILAFLILLSNNLNTKKILGAGIMFSIATLFKVPAAFEMPVIVILWLFEEKFNLKGLIKVSKKTIILFLGFIAPILLTFVWYFSRNGLSEYISAAFAQNVGYLSSWRPDDVQKSFIDRNLPLLIRGFIVFAGVTILYIYRKKLSLTFIFATIWLLLSLFAATLSERPYPHYLMQTVPPLSILVAILFTTPNKEQVFSIIPLFIFGVTSFYFKFWYYPTSSYYSRFLELATGRVTIEEYFKKFDTKLPRNYKIAEFLTTMTKPDDRVFVWGSTSTIYALSKRLPPIKYVTDYHVKDFYSPEIVLKDLATSPPFVIVLLPEADNFPQLKNFLIDNYLRIKTIDNAEIWHLMRR